MPSTRAGRITLSMRLVGVERLPLPLSGMRHPRHDGAMQSQAQRDRKTLDIATALLLFVGVVVLGCAFLVLAYLTVGLHDQTGTTIFWVLTAVGVAVAVCFLARRK